MHRVPSAIAGRSQRHHRVTHSATSHAHQAGTQHTISFGVIRGRLMVSPFKAGGFLIGLYRLDSAQLADMKPHETRPCQGVLATRNPMLPRRPAGPYTPRFEARSVSLP